MEQLLIPNVMDLLLDTVCVVDEAGRYVYVSASCERLLGYRQEELLGRNMIDLVHPDDRERTLEAAAEIMDGRSKTHFQNRYVRKDGRIVEIMWSARWSEEDRLRLAVARDITALRRAERMQAALYRISEAAHAADGLPALFEHIHRIVGELLPAENFCVVLYDRGDGTLSFPYCAGEQHPELQGHRPAAGTPIARVIESGEPVLATASADAGARTAPDPQAGHWLGIPLVASQAVIGALVVHDRADERGYTGEDRELLQFVSTQIATAIERKRAEERLHHMARHDPLTDLPNRLLFHDRLDMALRRARRDGEFLALLYLDLNEFKEVNDTFGHEAGDQLLREIARRLTGCIRASDTAGRMGGDEFTVLMPNVSGQDCVPVVVEKIRDLLAQPFDLDGHTVAVSASIGSALYPVHGENRDQLFRHADAAMYADKGEHDG